MRLFTKRADNLIIIYNPDERLRIGDTLFVDGIVAQVIDAQFADVPGVLEHVLRRSLIPEENVEQFMQPQVKNVIDSLIDRKAAIAKIRGRLVDEKNETEPDRTTFKSGLGEFDISRANAEITILDQNRLFSSLELKVPKDCDFCTTLSSQPQEFDLMAERLGVNLIAGMKGSGKSYAAKRLLLKLIHKGVLTLVVDINGEYLNLSKSEEGGSNLYGDKQLIKVYVPTRKTGPDQLPFKIPLHEISYDDFAAFFNIPSDKPTYNKVLEFWTENRGHPFDLHDFKSFVSNIQDAYIKRALEDRIRTAVAMKLFGPNDFIEEIKDMQKRGGALIFDLSKTGVREKNIIVEFILRKMGQLVQDEKIDPISLFLEEAQLYIDSNKIKDLLTRMRHLGVFPTFITNDPRSLPDVVYSSLDNLIAFKFRSEDDLRQLARSGLVDLESLYALKHLEKRQCLIVGEVTSLYPLFVEISPQQGVKMGGETRKLV
jgi:hypothetical protein